MATLQETNQADPSGEWSGGVESIEHRQFRNCRRAKKDGYRLLGSRLSINRLSSELSFDANRFQLMIIVR